MLQHMWLIININLNQNKTLKHKLINRISSKFYNSELLRDMRTNRTPNCECLEASYIPSYLNDFQPSQYGLNFPF